jgi:hypothetical protein
MCISNYFFCQCGDVFCHSQAEVLFLVALLHCPAQVVCYLATVCPFLSVYRAQPGSLSDPPTLVSSAIRRDGDPLEISCVCLIEQFIPTNGHRHIMSIVYFINSFPQYVFRRAYIAIFRGSLKVSNIDQYL